MNKRLLEVRIIIVVILIINNMNVDLAIHQNQSCFEIDPPRRVNLLLVDINEKIMMVDDKDHLETMVNHQAHNDLSEELENLDTNKLI
jgi:hypothetical protein